jgi:iron complex outermembrane recepter protein
LKRERYLKTVWNLCGATLLFYICTLYCFIAFLEPTMLTQRYISLSILFVLAANAKAQNTADAQDHAHGHDEQTLDTIVVSATSVADIAAQLNAPVEVLSDEALDAARSGTLGETLRGLAGVQSSSFGQAVARPIIRGLDGPRVLIAQNGISAMDVSSLSPDHAVTIEPFLADSIEILKGPASLFYGSGAIGGVVNVNDGRIARTLPDRLSARAQLEYGSNANERNAVVRIDAPVDRIAFHFDAFDRSADAYESAVGEVANTQLDTRGAALGASLVFDNGHFGAAVSRYENNYGIPNEEAVIDMAQTRLDLEGALRLDGFVEYIELRAGLNNYRHLELEGDEIGTRFDNDELQVRLDARHGAIGAFSGAWGLSLEDREVQANGEEAFVPGSDTRNVGVFLFEEYQFPDANDAFDLSFGLRADRNTVQTVDGRERRFNTPSAAITLGYQLSEANQLKFSADLATRAPQAEELFADGPHIATQSFEIGDETLRKEQSKGINIGWHVNTELLDFKLETYHTRFDRFIYLEASELVEDDLPVFFWDQRDARFSGVDFSAQLHAIETEAQSLHIGVLADRVGARFDDGSAIPRLSPMRFGASVDWHFDALQLGLKAIKALKPRQLATAENDTAGDTQFDLDASYAFDVRDQHWEVYLQGRNITDQEIRLHTSFLKDQAPLPGRNVKFGLRFRY